MSSATLRRWSGTAFIPPQPFRPYRLFLNGEEGVWYDPSDLSTLFQDSAGTTPVTASGDPVGLMLDKSGNDNHATQATSSKRPIYTEGSGLAWLEFDGVDDFLEFTQVISGTDPRSFIAATNQDSYDSMNNPLFALQSSPSPSQGGDWTLLLEDDFAYLRINGNSRFNYTDGTTPSAASVSSWRWSSARNAKSSYTSVRLNAVELTLNGGNTQDINTVNEGISRIGSSPRQNNSYFAGKYFGAILVASDISDELTLQVENHLAAKSGVIL